MSTSPVVQPVIAAGTLQYREKMVRHEDALDRYSVVLGFPSPELVQRATDHAAQQDRKHGHRVNPYRLGYPPDLCTQTGQIAAELLANHFRISAEWVTESDGGWDILVPTAPPIRIEVKCRSAFLTLEPAYFRRYSMHYYALVQHRDATAPYIFAGVVTPADWERDQFCYRYKGQKLMALTAADLFPAVQFNPFEM